MRLQTREREREREDNSNKQQRHKHNNDGGRFFVPIRDVDYNRGGGRGIVIRHPPVNRGGGGKAGTGVVKYKNSDFEASGTKSVTFLHQIFIINQSVLDPYQFQNLTAAGAF